MKIPTHGIDLTIFPDGLREQIAGRITTFAGTAMEHDEGDSGDETGDEPGQDEDEAGDEQLGDKGKRALAAERKRAADAEKTVKELTTKVDGFETMIGNLVKALGGDQDDTTEVDVVAEFTRLKGELEQRDAQAAARARRAAVTAAATAAGFHAPADALPHIDLDKVTLSEDGEPDTATVTALIADLAKSKPYLVKAKGTTPPAGRVGIGTQGTTRSTATGTGRIAGALKSD